MPHCTCKFSSVGLSKFNTIRKFVALLLAGVLLGIPIVNVADTNLHTVVLSIQGKFEGQNSEVQNKNVIELDLASLTKLESTTFTTNQPWTDEPKKYTGVRINTLLDHIGATSSRFEALASNEYTFILSDIDFEKYPVIIAYKIDGEFLETRKLGPLLIVFPFDDYPELLNESNKAASVWQLIEMRIL